MSVTHEILDQTVTMPVEVRDGTNATVMYDVDLAAAQALCPPGFEVVETEPGRASFVLALIDYRDNDLGAYLEIGTILFVRPEGAPADGSADGNFITHLPVTEEFTCVAGNRIWGFPKTVESITVINEETTSRWVLEMDGELVLDITVPRGGTDDMPPMELTSYTLMDGRPHRTTFTQGGAGTAMFVGAEVSLMLGTHPIAKELASLGLPEAPVVLTTWTERMRARFDEPTPL
jgi:hypothetical protein